MNSTSYVRDDRDLSACPNCGSGALVSVLPGRLCIDGCVGCMKFWERLPAGEPYTTDGEQLPFEVPCDNCAFRGKSEERTDKERWDDLMLQLAHGGEFYCHKAVPFSFRIGDEAGQPKAFEFPMVDKTATIEGQTHRYRGYEVDRMRLCRGFLNRFVGGPGHTVRNANQWPVDGDGREVES